MNSEYYYQYCCGCKRLYKRNKLKLGQMLVRVPGICICSSDDFEYSVEEIRDRKLKRILNEKESK